MASANSTPKTTPPIVATFLNVFEMKTSDSGVRSYSACLLFNKSNQEHMDFLKELHADMQQVLAEQWPNEATRPRNPLVGHQTSAIKDGDTYVTRSGIPTGEQYPERIGHYFIDCSNFQEGTLPVVSRFADEKGVPMPISDRAQIYSGVIVKASINAYARTRADNPGISIGLNGIQKWAEGERLGGGAPPSVDSMFSADMKPGQSTFGGAPQGGPPQQQFYPPQGQADAFQQAPQQQAPQHQPPQQAPPQQPFGQQPPQQAPPQQGYSGQPGPGQAGTPGQPGGPGYIPPNSDVPF